MPAVHYTGRATDVTAFQVKNLVDQLDASDYQGSITWNGDSVELKLNSGDVDVGRIEEEFAAIDSYTTRAAVPLPSAEEAAQVK